jgi:hypothetical protein
MFLQPTHFCVDAGLRVPYGRETVGCVGAAQRRQLKHKLTRRTLRVCAAMAFILTCAWPTLAEATCDAGHPPLGCCAGSVLRGCDVNNNPFDSPCNTKAPNPVYGPYYCGHDNTTQSLMSCYTADLIDYAPATGNVWCPGFCLYGCSGDNCPGNCSADQTCNNGTCQDSSCGHISYFRSQFASYLNQPGPPAMSRLKSMCSGYSGFGYGVRENGTLVHWGDQSQTTGVFDDPHNTSITNAVQVACGQYHVTVLLSDGTVVAWGGDANGTNSGVVNPPGGLSNVVALAGATLGTAALKSDGSIVIWGSDIAGVWGSLNGKTGFKAIAGGSYGHFLGLKTDGTVVEAAADGTSMTNKFDPVPTGLSGVIQVGIADEGAIALKQDGTVVTWGSHAAGPPGDLKPVKFVAAANPDTTQPTFLALQVDGTVRVWGNSIPGSLSAAIAALHGVYFLDPSGCGVLYCDGTCGAISPDGCCDGDKVHRCSPFGTDVVSTCSAGTCGWQTSASDYECSTPGAPAPGNRLIQSCICVPSCKNTDGTTKQCGSDGCGGTCDKGGCEDGDPCTVKDTCSGEACIAGGPYNCSDNNACTEDACSNVSGAASCTSTPNTAPCDDANACTSGDMCASGACAGGAAIDCNDANVCTDDSCAPATGCGHLANASTCSDGSACTVGDICANSACTGGTTPLNCDDGNACSIDSCDASLGCQHVDADSATICDDNSNCTANDHCVAGGKCTGTSNVNCDDNNPCTSDNCLDPNTCAPHDPIADGTVCSDGNACHLGGKCAAGICSGLTSQNCDDGNPCTDDGCDAKSGCTHANNTAPCSDGSTCTAGDICAGGTCTSGAPVSCDDKNVCTDDSCDKGLGCQHVANALPCDDKSVCTQSDNCAAGICVGSNLQNCDDGQICTTDNCNAILGCQHAGNTAPCNDGNACTKGDACWQGTCVGGATPSCNDGNSCTNDSCDAQKGCVYTANSNPCDDLNPCTLGDTCNLGGCIAGSAKLNCNDGNPCTNDSCAPGKGCFHSNNNLACDDGSVCTLTDTCSAGTCVGVAKSCSDSNVCTDDKCDAVTGCFNPTNTAPCDDGNVCTSGDTCAAGACLPGQPNTLPCSDGNICTVNDMCAAGACTGGAAKACDDGDPCTGDHCAPTGAGPTGCFHSTWDASGNSCNDGNACTLSDTCHGGDCKGVNACVNGGCNLSTAMPTCTCPAGWVSQPYGNSVSYCCHPDCANKACGPDGCGGQCSNLCTAEETCDVDWNYHCHPKLACYGKAPVGINCCDGDKLERCFAPNSLYTNDCAALGKHCGWSAVNGAYDCTDDGLTEPSGTFPFKCPTAGACTPNCSGGKVCGPDGCGGFCGTCGAGLVCDVKVGQCLNPCDGLAPTAGCFEGSLNGQDVLATCPNIHGKTADVVQTVCPAGQTVGWSNWQKRYLCGGTDTAPAGIAKACPVQACACGIGVFSHNCGDNGCGGSCGTCTNADVCVKGNCCTPDCTGKNCGDDGCGGSCGTCTVDQTCMNGGHCTVPDCVGMSNPGGQCLGNSGAMPVEYCSDNAKVTLDCGSYGAGCVKGGRATCVYSTYQFSKSGGGFNSYWTTHCNGRPADQRCANIGQMCDCGPDCVANGNCCEDYDATCSAGQFHPSCGDKTCDKDFGETCATCSADCGACTDATKQIGPWQMPYPAVISNQGRPEARASYAIHPLDDVRPQGPPLPLEGLLALQSGIDGIVTAPGVRVVTQALKTGGALAAVSDGVQGQGVSLVDSNGHNRGAALQVFPGTPLPTSSSFGRHNAGGLTIAGWFRTSSAAQGQANTLGTARIPSASGGVSCNWSRPQESSAPVSCGSGTVVAIEAYYGDVATHRFPPYTDGNGGVADIACSLYDQLGPTYKCQDPSVQQLAEKNCLGKSSCWVDPWQQSLDPCSVSPYTPMKSTLMLRALCDTGPLSAVATLVVDPAAEGRHLRLAGPGLPAIQSQSEIQAGAWTHVALTFAPHAPGSPLGTLALYINGKPEAQVEAYPFPQFREWDWGLGHVDGVLNTADGYVDPAKNTAAPNLAGHFDLDDAALYNRPLAQSELATLVSKPNLGTLRTWPGVDALRVAKGGYWSQGGTPALAQIQTPQLVDPATGQDLAADFSGLTFGAGHFAAPAEGSDLNGLASYSVGAWIRPGALTSTSVLFDVTQGATHRLKLSVDTTCNGAGIRADLASGSSVTSSNCDHVLTANTWMFISYVQSGTTGTLYVDGSKLGSATVSGSLFDATASGVRTTSTGAGVDLGWIALYGRALAVDELNAQRSQGPAVWVDGALYTPTGATTAKPRDFAGFVNSGMTGDTGRPVAADSTGLNGVSGSKIGNGMVKVPAKGRFHSGSSNGKPNAGTQAFSYVGTAIVKIDTGGTFTLVRYLDDLGYVQTRGRLVCATSSVVGTLNCHVDVASDLTWSGGSATYKPWSSNTFAVTGSASQLAIRVALAFDGTTPSAAVTVVDAVGQAAVKLTKGAATLDGAIAQELSFTRLGQTQESAATLKAAYTGRTLELPALPTLEPFGLPDVRLYARVLSGAELRLLAGVGCSGQRCGDENRVCVTPANGSGYAMQSPASLAACTGCVSSTYEVAGVCHDKAPFHATCSFSEDCLTGLCSGGVCLASTQSDACNAGCLALGRTCANNYNGAFDCSYCAKDFSAVGSKCVWSPPSSAGDTCATSQDCTSGVCSSRTTTNYGVTNTDTKLTKPLYTNSTSYSIASEPTGPFETCSSVDQCAVPAPKSGTENVCAAATTQSCSEMFMESRIVHSATWDGTSKDAYVCDGCKKDTYQGEASDPNNGKPLYVQAWTLLSPDACRTIYKNYFDLLSGGIVTVGTTKYHNDGDGWSDNLDFAMADKGDILAYPPSIPRLRRLLLKDSDPTSAVTPQILANLEVAGVGRSLLAPTYKTWFNEQQFYPTGGSGNAWRPEQMRLGACAREHYDFTNYEGWKGGHANSKFFDHDVNHPVCVENKFPEGTPCPPASTTKTYTRANAGLFCTSGFCAADDKVCEIGFQGYEETHGGSRNDGNSGGGGNDMGAIALIQDNGSAFRFDKVDETTVTLAAGTTDHRHIFLEGHSKNSVNIFGWTADILDLSVTVVEAPGAADEADQADVVKEFLICGVQPPSLPELPKASCGAVEFKDGEYQAPKCKMDKAPIGVSASHTVKKKDKKTGKETEKETSIEVTGGDLVPTITYHVPLPLEECPEELDGFKAVYGRVCFAKQTAIGPVPFKVEAEVAPEASVEFGVELDSETFEPAAKITPAVGLSLEVKGGVGGEIGPVEIFAGVKAAITIIEAALPVSFGFAFEQLTDDNNSEIEDLWVVSKVIKAEFELSFLKLALSLFFEVGVGPVKLELEYGFFDWDGIQLSWELGQLVAEEYKVDFQWDSYATSTASGHGGTP